MTKIQPGLIQLRANDPLPPLNMAWGPETLAPGLLAIGGGLSVARLLEAYGQACFPWYSEGQPVMWWNTDPRMVLKVDEFKFHDSLRKLLKQLLKKKHLEIRVNHDFSKIIQACSSAARNGQNGTWIVNDMVNAYQRLHEAGFAHSIETWIHGELRGGLYFVSIGKAVFGESMFSLEPNASKLALAALICMCKIEQVSMIDCQQNTRHLASLGARPIQRLLFYDHVCLAKNSPNIHWRFEPLYWNQLMLEYQKT
jgi:leucyl/phenylalanyl-tRNA---protein transferase